MTQCWFCEKNEANPDTSVTIGFQNILDQHYEGKKLVTKFESMRIQVPRCKACEDRTHKSGMRNMIGGSLLMFFLAGGFILKAVFPDLGFVSKWVFPCSGALIGVILGMVTAVSGGDTDDIKPTKAALEYPKVKAMRNQTNWVIDDIWEKEWEKICAEDSPSP